MLLQWCLKGVSYSKVTFADVDARRVLAGDGLRATWLRNATGSQADLPSASDPILSQTALDAHVNGFGASASSTPYLSLTAGCRERDRTRTRTFTYPALKTALSFATRDGTTDGYIFRLWVMVTPKPAPELPGFGEEVRSLLASPQFSTFHHEGEVAAKLYVPARQILEVMKYNRDLTPAWSAPETNPSFVPPERINNVLELI